MIAWLTYVSAGRYDHTEFEPLGKMSLIGRSYLVPFRIDSEGLLNQLEPIEQGLTKVQTLFDSVQQNLIYQKGRKQLQPDDHITTF